MTIKAFLKLFSSKATSRKWKLVEQDGDKKLLRTADDDQSCPLTVALGIHWAQRDAFKKAGAKTYHAVMDAADCGYSHSTWDKKLRSELLKICGVK